MSIRNPPQHETCTRILDAAEELFMQHGFEGTSMRQLTSRAGVNLRGGQLPLRLQGRADRGGARRRLDPMNAARIAALEELEKETARCGPRRSSARSSTRCT